MKMGRNLTLFFLLFAIYVVHCETDQDEYIYKLPKLFHLDDFERCLARKDGVYCVGKFEIYSDVQPNPLYDLIQEKSQNRRLYNRSYLHRGYCLPTRCADGKANATARFERCVDAWARRLSLRARLHTLHYCRAHGQPVPGADTNDVPHTVFLYVVYAFLFMNALGTLYDVIMGNRKDKNEYLMLFSLRVNWSKLMQTGDVSSSRRNYFDVMNGSKVLLILWAFGIHAGQAAAVSWIRNPRSREKFCAHPAGGGMFGALTTATQSFVFISIFLATTEVLKKSEKNKMNMSATSILSNFLKRVLRILPVYILVTGFCATWWNSIGDGPIWPLIVGKGSKACRDKFWLHFLFLQHIFEPDKICNGQTWVIAADMHLYIPVMIMTYILIKKPHVAGKLLPALLAVATAITTHLALTRRYEPFFYHITPENTLAMLTTIKTFTELLFMPTNCLITMVVAVWFAFYCHNSRRMQHQGKDEKEKKPSKLLMAVHYISITNIFVWSFLCAFLIPYTDPVFMALMITIERLVNVMLYMTFFYTCFNVKSPLVNIFAWRKLRILSRMLLSISMIHCSVHFTLNANQPQLVTFGMELMTLNALVTFVITIILAIPLTLFVDIPMSELREKLLP